MLRTRARHHLARVLTAWYGLARGASALPAPMKAIRVSAYGGPEVLKLEEIPAPQPGAGQVLVRNHAVGVNPVDTYLRSNTDNRGPKLPYTPGSDTAGVGGSRGTRPTSAEPGGRA